MLSKMEWVNSPMAEDMMHQMFLSSQGQRGSDPSLDVTAVISSPMAEDNVSSLDQTSYSSLGLYGSPSAPSQSVPFSQMPNQDYLNQTNSSSPPSNQQGEYVCMPQNFAIDIPKMRASPSGQLFEKQSNSAMDMPELLPDEPFQHHPPSFVDADYKSGGFSQLSFSLPPTHNAVSFAVSY